MQVNKLTEFGAGAGLTATEETRRRQLIDATIATLADLGYARTSFARIVEYAGLSSTRMISYHFADKEDLMMATLGALIDRQDTVLQERLGDEKDLTRLLLGYLSAEVAYLGTHPAECLALAEIGTHARAGDDSPVFAEVWHGMRVGRLERQLAQGQRAGVFRDFDVRVMALAIRQAIDGVTLRLRREPDLDVETYGRELEELFDRALRPE